MKYTALKLKFILLCGETNFKIKVRNTFHTYVDDEAPLRVGNTGVTRHRL